MLKAKFKSFSIDLSRERDLLTSFSSKNQESRAAIPAKHPNTLTKIVDSFMIKSSIEGSKYHLDK
jgi:hypothetical protein